MKQNQKGFGALEGILILVIIGLVSFTGWYVYHASHKTNSLLSSTSKNPILASTCVPLTSPGNHTYTNAKKGYCVSLPAKWNYIKGKTFKDNTGQVVKDSNGNGSVAPDSIEPIGSPQNTAEGIAEVYTDKSTLDPKAYFETSGAGRAVYSPGEGTTTSINGYPAYIANLGGESPAKVVTVSHSGKIVEFFYYTNSSMNPYVALSEQITNSIKFL